MERNKLDIILVWISHFGENFSETNEWNILLVNVALVNFISYDDYLFGMANFNDLLNILSFKNISSRVSWIDNNHTSQVNSKVLCILDSLYDLFSIDTPSLLFVKIVLDHGSSIKSQQS